MNEQCYYRVSVKGIVINDEGKILLSREDNGKWEMLGGGLDHDEDPIECLRREILEETGLRVTYVSPSPKYFVTAPRLGSATTTYMANVIYEIQLESLEFIASDECQELRFFSIEEMAQVELVPNVQKLLEILQNQ
jgi:8-oxo-dGTP diphosphatase